VVIFATTTARTLTRVTQAIPNQSKEMRKKRVKFKTSEKSKKRKKTMKKDGVSKGDLTELVNFKNPPQVVINVTCAFSILLKKSTGGNDWSSAKNALTMEDAKAFEAMDTFDSASVKKATKLLDGLTKESVAKISAAAVSIYVMVAKKLGLETSESKEETASEPLPSAKPQQLYRSPIKTVVPAAVIHNIKSLTKPPAAVQTTLRAWFLILGCGDCTWAESKKQLADQYSLAKRVSEFNPKNAQRADVKKSQRVLKSLKPANLEAIFHGLSSIADWCEEVYQYENEETATPQKLRNPFKMEVIPIEAAA